MPDTKLRAIMMASVLVCSMAVGAGVFAGTATAGVGTADRAVPTTDVGPGQTVTVTTSATFDTQTSRVSIGERFGTPFKSVDNLTVKFRNGSGSTVFTNAANDGVDVAMQDITAGTTVVVSYTVTIPESATAGSSFNVTGSVTPSSGSSVDVGTTTLSVTTLESNRVVETGNVTPGGTANVSLNVTALTGVDRLVVTERFSGPVESASIESVETSSSGLESVTSIVNADGLDYAFQNLSAETTITITYSVTVSENATRGQQIDVDGNVSASGQTVTNDRSTISVVMNSKQAIAGDDDKVDTNELRNAVQSWVSKNPVAGSDPVSTSDLRDLITAWVTDEEV